MSVGAARRRVAAVSSLVVASLVLTRPSTATAEPTYAETTRVAHLRASLDALAKLGSARGALEIELSNAVRTKCRVNTTRPATTCMAEVGRAICAARPDRAACIAAADVMLTNQHAETDMIDDITRMKLVRGSTDYHAAIGAEMWAKYALLASELVLAPPAEPAARIDAFCVGRDHTVHACEPGAKACLASVAYQRCAAGLAWFLANQEGAR
jgi:hypothetical protein